MKIGVIFDWLDPRRGGAEACLSRVLPALMERGHQVVVHSLRPAPGPWRTVCCGRRFGLRGGRERSFSRWASRSARDGGCEVLLGVRHVDDVDVYQPHGGTWAATVEGKDRARRRGAGWKIGRALSSRHREFARADRAVFERHPGLITLAVSEWVAQDVRRRYGHARPEVRVLWPPVEVPEPDPEARPRIRGRIRGTLGVGEGPLLLFVAHQFREKGLPCALQALAGLGDPAARLAVVGRGDLRGARRWARGLGVSEQVVLLGARSDVAELMAAADLLVHPTFHDPCSLVCLEARELGLPVVTSGWNGAAPWVEGHGAVVEDPWNTPALVRAVEDCLPRGIRVPSPGAEFRLEHHVDGVERALREAAR